MKFNQFLLTPYFGPGLLPHAQTLWIDELAVATKRVVGPVVSLEPLASTLTGTMSEIGHDEHNRIPDSFLDWSGSGCSRVAR